MHYRLCAAIGVSMLMIDAAGSIAAGQQRTAEELDADLKARALTRAASDRSPPGEPAKEVVEGEVNWIAMKTELARSERRDIAARQSVTAAVARPPGVRAAAAQSFKTVVVREVNQTRLPLLAPEGGRIAQTLKVYSLGDSYSATAEVEDGVAMRISGARKKIVVGDARSARTRIATMRAEQKTLASVDAAYIVSRSETSTDLSFSKFGAGYVLSIMCDDPADPRCAEDELIVNLASNMMLLNSEAGDQ